MNAFVGLALLAGLFSAPNCHSQPVVTRPEFEVASVKLHPNCDARTRGVGVSPGRLNLSCVSLRNLIQTSYGGFNGPSLNPTPPQVLGGPAWLDTDLYDVSAKAEGPALLTEMGGPMMQALLGERFQLKVHKESRDTSVYALVTANGGPELRVSKEGSCIPIDPNNLPRTLGTTDPTTRYCGLASMKMRGGSWSVDWLGATMADFAGWISGHVDRAAIDKTGLSGRFDIHLEFADDAVPAGPARLGGVEAAGAPAFTAEETGPSIFTAVQQQLQLKLQPAKAAVEVIVVDRAERPSEN
jgi:uncharacterized protein (TIGR03435 family)